MENIVSERNDHRLHCCVTGATGYIGRQLIMEIMEQGHTVTILTRREVSGISTKIRVCIGDLLDSTSDLPGFLRGCDVVLHCAAELRDTTLMRRLHVEGTANLLFAVRKEALRQEREIHFVQLSSVGVYGPSDSRKTVRVVREETKCRPVGEYETTKFAADELVIQAAESGIISFSILRPSIVFGVGMPNDSLRALIAMVRRGLFFYIGNIPAVANYVHVEDVVAAIIKLASEKKAKNQIFNLSFDCTLDQLIQKIAILSGVHTPQLHIPEWMVRLAVKLLAFLPKFPLTITRVNALVGQTYYPNDKIARELGFLCRRTMPDAIKDLVCEIR